MVGQASAENSLSPDKAHQDRLSLPAADDPVVIEIANMIADWEQSDELTTDFARRVVATVRARTSEFQ